MAATNQSAVSLTVPQLPLGQGGRAAGLVSLAINEMTFEIEVVKNGFSAAKRVAARIRTSLNTEESELTGYPSKMPVIPLTSLSGG